MVVPLFATHVEAIGRFLKIYGQTNHNEGLSIEAAILALVQSSPQKVDMQLLRDRVQVGSLCLSRYNDGQFYRCKVIDQVAADQILVHFIDYGNDEILSIKDMLTLEDRRGDTNADFLLSVAPQAKEYVLAGYWNTHWTEEALAEIRGLVVNEVVKVECYSSVRDLIFINIAIEERGIQDLSQYLIEQRDIGQVIDLRSQRELLMLVVDGLEEEDQQQLSHVVYTSNTLNMHSRYDVAVSHVQDGPFLFCVQLKRELAELDRLMAELQRVQLRQSPTDVLVGMACLVRKDRVYRGLVTLMGPSSVVVCLVDFGRSVTVSYQHLFEIPAQFLRQKVFAIRSSIAGHKKLDRHNQEMKLRFADLVTGPAATNLTIKVTPLEGTSALHYCDVFSDTQNVFDDLLKLQTRSFVLGENEPIPSGYVGPVRVTACHSPARFFVRHLRKEEEYQRLAVVLNEYFQEANNRPALSEIRIGAICALKTGSQWHRAEILDIKKTEDGKRTVIVNLVDVGRDVEIGLTLLKRLNFDLAQVPPLAIECSLHRVKVEDNPGVVAQFARAIDAQRHPERVFTLKVSTTDD